MKGIYILIIRLLLFFLYVVTGINAICCYCGIDMTLSYELHGNSDIYALSLLLISLANKHYHCVWNRAMYAFLIFVPMVNFVDSAFCVFPTDRAYMLVVVISYILTAIITAHLAIRHFIQMSKRRLDNGRR